MKNAWLAVAMVGISLKAHALGGLADVQVLDRDTGCVLPTYRHQGEYWIAGRPGARYSIVIHNRGAQRVLAVTAVDGVNVISGESGAWGQTGYVFDPGQSYDIPGWRKSQQEVADFNFTAASDSYAARTGRPANVGVIGVALFLEKSPLPATIMRFSSRLGQNSAAAESARAASASAAPKLGTGHGAREASYVREVEFDRQSSTPNEIIRIRYDSLENLIAMGVVDRRQTPWPVPNPFPDSGDPKYVPDPPGGG